MSNVQNMEKHIKVTRQTQCCIKCRKCPLCSTGLILFPHIWCTLVKVFFKLGMCSSCNVWRLLYTFSFRKLQRCKSSDVSSRGTGRAQVWEYWNHERTQHSLYFAHPVVIIGQVPIKKTERNKDTIVVENVLHNNSYCPKIMTLVTCIRWTYEQERNETTKYVIYTDIGKGTKLFNFTKLKITFRTNTIGRLLRNKNQLYKNKFLYSDVWLFVCSVLTVNTCTFEKRECCKTSCVSVIQSHVTYAVSVMV